MGLCSYDDLGVIVKLSVDNLVAESEDVAFLDFDPLSDEDKLRVFLGLVNWVDIEDVVLEIIENSDLWLNGIWILIDIVLGTNILSINQNDVNAKCIQNKFGGVIE